ncbi:MAG: hypothetical protein WAU88_06430 [Candidatus Zixiibacteriota bacterium]
MSGDPVDVWWPSMVGRFLTLLILCSLVVTASATSLRSEELEMDSIVYDIAELPLEPYIATLDHRPQLTRYKIICTGNWQGYIGSWKIEHDSLFLTRLQMLFPTDTIDYTQRGSEWQDAPLELYFPNRQLPIFADWYSGTITLPCGEMIKWQGMATRFEQEIELYSDSGQVGSKLMLDLSGLGNFRSFEDYRACGPLNQIVDTGDWLDLRWVTKEFFPYPDEQTRRYKTRGLLFKGVFEGAPYVTLSIPRTPVTQRDWMSFDQFPSVKGFPESSRVECGIVHTSDEYVIVSIRVLEKNESIYARNYPEMLRQRRHEYGGTIPSWHHK